MCSFRECQFMFELQQLPWVKRRSGEKKLFARRACRLLGRNRKPRLAREERAGAECPAVSMETSVTLQRILSMLSRLNSEGRNKSKMAQFSSALRQRKCLQLHSVFLVTAKERIQLPCLQIDRNTSLLLETSHITLAIRELFRRRDTEREQDQCIQQRLHMK